LWPLLLTLATLQCRHFKFHFFAHKAGENFALSSSVPYGNQQTKNYANLRNEAIKEFRLRIMTRMSFNNQKIAS